MSGYSIQTLPPPKPLLPAWLLSVLIHAATFALLFAAVDLSPRGSKDASPGSIGILLNRSGGESSPGEREPYAVTQAAAHMEAPAAPELLASAPTNTDENSATKTEAPDQEQQKQQNSKSSTTKSAARQNGSRGKSKSGKSTSRALLGSAVGSGYAQVSVFGVQGKGNKFIYVFDRSSSMEGPPLAAAKKQLLDSLQSLDSIHQFHIIFFNTKTQAFDISGGGRRIAFASDRNKKLAANFVGGITADGGTDRTLALLEAINFAPDVIFFLTDADDPMSPSELSEIGRANRRAQATICVIEFGKKPAPVPNNFLARLARENGGQYGYVDTTKLR